MRRIIIRDTGTGSSVGTQPDWRFQPTDACVDHGFRFINNWRQTRKDTDARHPDHDR